MAGCQLGESCLTSTLHKSTKDLEFGQDHSLPSLFWRKWKTYCVLAVQHPDLLVSHLVVLRDTIFISLPSQSGIGSGYFCACGSATCNGSFFALPFPAYAERHPAVRSVYDAAESRLSGHRALLPQALQQRETDRPFSSSCTQEPLH